VRALSDETRTKVQAAPAVQLDWYKDAVIYQLHIRSFFDSNADGVGDFPGLTQKLDYLQDLGVTAIWLLPFYPSPLRDDGYDISDYGAVNPQYGTLRDFGEFLRQAHRRGLRVITELVLNHTSDQHPWFQRARRAKPGSRERDYYVWSDSPDGYRDTRIIFKDFETSNWAWDPVAKAYYWHRFYSHQPDLNFDNPEVREEMFRRLDFWLRRGVDGVRLDAIPYLFEREGTNCENLPETHAFLKQLRRHVDEEFPGRMLLAEANQWPEEAVHYLGDECHMAFHFPLMPRLFMAVRMETRYPIVDILAQTPSIDGASQWAIFLRNHDELTLEMVTDEERDYMYRVYAHDPNMRINLGIRRRLAPLLQNDRKRIELMNSLLFSLPGTPIVYYGDEIGMGDNYYLGDRNAVRTPMQWSADRNAGFSRATPQRLLLPVIIDPEYHYEAVNVETQLDNPHSLLWWMKRLVSLRKRFRAFGRGSLEFLHPENFKVLSFVRRWEDECILVVANLSRFAQPVELDLRAFEGSVPVELFGKTRFPRIGETPYSLTLGPHSFYWFSIEPPEEPEALDADSTDRLPVLIVDESWKELFGGKGSAQLAAMLPSCLGGARWFGGKARRILDVRVVETVPVGAQADDPLSFVLVVLVEYVDGEPERYLLPLSLAPPGEAPRASFAVVRKGDGTPVGVLHDSVSSPPFCSFLLSAIERRRRFRGTAGEITLRAVRSAGRSAAAADPDLAPAALGAEQTNTSVRFGQRYILKLFRRLHDGPNPDLEIGRVLTESGFEHAAAVAGELAWNQARGPAVHLGILQEFVPSEGDAWTLALDALGRFFERALARSEEREAALPPPPAGSPRVAAQGEVPPEVLTTIGTSMERMQLLGRRTAELHGVLASRPDDREFAPEPFSSFDRRSLYQSMRNEAGRGFELLRKRASRLPGDARAAADAVLGRENDVLDYYRRVVDLRVGATRIRCHGDYHLGQVLYTGKDFVIIDFEGEPSRSLAERRLKKSPLVDVAGMVRSFHYAASSALRAQDAVLRGGPEGDALERAARLWYEWVTAAFMKGYLEAAGPAPFLPADGRVFDFLLNALLLQKAVYELEYELNNRPDWAAIPLAGILACLESPEPEGETE